MPKYPDPAPQGTNIAGDPDWWTRMVRYFNENNYYFVENPDWGGGAVGNNSTDNTSRFTTLMGAIPTATPDIGATVQFGTGIYRAVPSAASVPTINASKNGLTIRGVHPKSSILKVDGATVGDQILVQSVNDVTIENLGFDQTYPTRTADGAGISLVDCKRVRIRNCHFNNMSGTCIYLLRCEDVWVENCYSENTGLGFWRVEGTAGTTNRNLWVINNSIVDWQMKNTASHAAIQVHNLQTVTYTDIWIENNKLRSTRTTGANNTGISTDVGSRVRIKGNRVQFNGRGQGIRATGRDYEISGNYVNNGVDAPGILLWPDTAAANKKFNVHHNHVWDQSSGIAIAYNASSQIWEDLDIHDNHCWDSLGRGGGGSQDYGILSYLQAGTETGVGVRRGSIHHNHIYDNDLGAYSIVNASPQFVTHDNWVNLTTKDSAVSFTLTRPVFLQVVSSDAPAYMKDGADVNGLNGVYLTDGTADDVQINAALAAATGEGGESKVLLSGGRFFCANSVLLQTGVCLEGCGNNTELRAINITAQTGFGAVVALVKAAALASHAYRITNMYVNGNYASGGTGSGIHIVGSSASNDYAGYPDTNPDPDIKIDNLLVNGFGNGTTRSGIVLDTDIRGTIIDSIQMRNISQHGIWFLASPDSHITNVHMGTVTGTGFYIQGGNVKLVNNKAFYCDDAGLRVTSGRGQVSTFESQDNNIGAVFAAEPAVCNGLIVDTFQADGVIISTSGYQLIGCQILQRATGRYATGARGLTISGTLNDMNVQVDVTPASITTPVSNIAGLSGGLRNFYRITTESGSLLSGG